MDNNLSRITKFWCLDLNLADDVMVSGLLPKNSAHNAIPSNMPILAATEHLTSGRFYRNGGDWHTPSGDKPLLEGRP